MSALDVRGFYAALGVQLPAWATREAPVHCFADADAHNRADRTPSCSVNLTSGAWNCHGCGACGGAYDAALATGHTPRSTMDLLISHGLAMPRTPDRRPRVGTTASVPRACPPPSPFVRPALAADEDDVRLWVEMLDADSPLVRRLARERAWSSSTIRELDVGFDGARITIPVRNAAGQLRGVLRYDPFGPREPKMLAVPGTRLGVIPHPAREPSSRVVLVEGPPDMVAARSCGLPAIAVPGTSAWQSSWTQLLAGRSVTVVMDCDAPGRRAAKEVATTLQAAGIPVDVVDLSPDRRDGYDLTDRILERRRTRSGSRATRTIASLLRPIPPVNRNTTRPRARSNQEVAR